jgi:hypothetical protein
MTFPIHPHWRSTRDDASVSSDNESGERGHYTVLFRLLMVSAGALIVFALLVEGVHFLRAQLTSQVLSPDTEPDQLIVLQDYTLPPMLTLRVGETVRFSNMGSQPRHLMSDDRDQYEQILFQTPLIAPGEHYTFQVPDYLLHTDIVVRDVLYPTAVARMITRSAAPPPEEVPELSEVPRLPVESESYEPTAPRPFPDLLERDSPQTEPPPTVSGSDPQEPPVLTLPFMVDASLPAKGTVELHIDPGVSSQGQQDIWPTTLRVNRFTVDRIPLFSTPPLTDLLPVQDIPARAQVHAASPARPLASPPPATGPALGVLSVLSLCAASLLKGRRRR